MATVLFAAAGAAFGSGFGGTLLGISGAVLGRAVGATVGRVIDQRLMGLGSEAVEVGRLDRFRIMGASEGAAIARVWGRMRVPGQVIWASPFSETSSSSGGGGGKGTPKPRTVQFSYNVTLAIALCEGEILGVGRIWADGAEIDPSLLDLRVYRGTADQMPDPAMEAALGAGLAPAFRDTAYVVIETMDLSAFGNRVPQLSFEVIRQADKNVANAAAGYDDMIRAVALIPGTGEYALATEQVNMAAGLGTLRPVNVNARSGTSDFVASFDQLQRELPGCNALSLVVSWFGNDLRCGSCNVQPKVEQSENDAVNMPWRAGGIRRAQAGIVPKLDGRSIYGGTPADASVLQAIEAATSAGQKVMFYPFVLMEQLPGNGLPDPYGFAAEQPALPWRGRITLAAAPGTSGSSDQTLAADIEVAAFFGKAQPLDFLVQGSQITYSGPEDWGYRRFILHYAHLCKIAGGVDAFCIGSELRGLTQIRGVGHSFPTVSALRLLAAEVREILGPSTKISYASDWSEYFGYHTGGNVYFHLDPLWADANIDFIGIDNYMPLSDWRDEVGHADAAWKSNTNLEYLKFNICGGEGFDWYYDGDERRDAQLRQPIEDSAFGEPWVFRYKDLPSWWGHLHHNRIDGQRDDQPTAWIPRSKPIWFTEYGCAALDKGTNEPNKFLDPKSSESAFPRYSNGNRNDYLQFQYFRAMHEFWNNDAKNLQSDYYSGRMVDTNKLFAWAWDSRPYPEFPRNEDLWSDGVNYRYGHWLNGRASAIPMDNLVREVCSASSIDIIDTSDLHGLVTGYSVSDIESVRSILQPLSLSYGFDAIEIGGTMRFVSRGIESAQSVCVEHEALDANLERTKEVTRSAESEVVGRARLIYVSSEGDFAIKVAEQVFSDDDASVSAQSEFSLTMTAGQAKATVERWLAEARTARDTLKIRLPASDWSVRAGSVLQMDGATYRVDCVEIGEGRLIEAVRIETSQYLVNDSDPDESNWAGFVAPSSVWPVWIDLPLMRGAESPHAPHIAATAEPWPGRVAIWDADQDDGYAFLSTIDQPAMVGITLTPLLASRAGLIDRGPALRVRLSNGTLSSTQIASFLNGSNSMVIGDGSVDGWEVFQFQSALLVDPDTYDLSSRLRGQVGTDAEMLNEWPTGSTVVLLNSALRQIPLLPSLRGITRHYRVGAAERGYDDTNVSHHVLSFKGIGMRPYSIKHLHAHIMQNGDVNFSWIRRTRIDGDSWDSYEVPLGEEAEAYEVTLRAASGAVLRSDVTFSSTYGYSRLAQTQDGARGSVFIDVAQISNSFGPGPSSRLEVVIL